MSAEIHVSQEEYGIKKDEEISTDDLPALVHDFKHLQFNQLDDKLRAGIKEYIDRNQFVELFRFLKNHDLHKPEALYIWEKVKRGTEEGDFSIHKRSEIEVQ